MPNAIAILILSLPPLTPMSHHNHRHNHNDNNDNQSYQHYLQLNNGINTLHRHNRR